MGSNPTLSAENGPSREARAVSRFPTMLPVGSHPALSAENGPGRFTFPTMIRAGRLDYSVVIWLRSDDADVAIR